MPGRLILCATPIGNLGDVSGRLAEALSSCDLIYAEDTRRTATLVRHLGVTAPLRSYFAGNEDQRRGELASRLEAGQSIALVTDAGTPAISDPGASAVAAARAVGSEITVIPGASAVTAALAVSGLGADRFVFEGFLPKRGRVREVRLAAMADEQRTVVFFSPPQRVARDLADLAAVAQGERSLVVCRELTKLHEEVMYTTLSEAVAHWAQVEPRGEFTIVLEGAVPAPGDLPAALRDVSAAIGRGETLSESVRAVSTAQGVSRRQLYQAAIEAGLGDTAG